ncbi:hypothetical protein DLAC_02418 [Tieghemostelium lacteum]|uniref:Fungal lipase-type domain-containing protein n=1 Tax=Tieghemostelium lacteum TaxID=361077 RepID=A0A152A4G6_TIELA|nr:hypothetical protein DLAC_02418 [Tieghemostelium lacteum]|eukprot:KYR00977.1 hypothetical protein DLAC_02418 [Tieghemostelium lacteum]
MRNGLFIISTIFILISITVSIGITLPKTKTQQHIKIENPSPVTNFSLSTAFEHLMYSYASYCTEVELSNWTCPYCTLNGYLQPLRVTQYLVNNSTNTFGYIGVTGDNQTVVVTFRGTQFSSLENWITNLNFPKSQPYPSFSGALVHEGFYEAYRSVSSQLQVGIIQAQKECPQCQKLIITGHSLGGALAILCALDVYESGYSQLPLEMYTFGNPRVGNVAFIEYFEQIVLQSIHRLVNDRDIVPHLPPIDLNFYHLPIEVWFNNASAPLQYKICNNSGEDPSCSDSLDVALNIEQHLDYMGINKDLC